MWLSLSPFLFQQKEPPSKERGRARGGGGAEIGGGNKKREGRGAGAGGAQSQPAARLRLTRAPARRHCLYTVRSWPQARSPPAHASLFSKSEAPQPPRQRQQREPESLLAAPPAVRARKSGSREPREPALRPPAAPRPGPTRSARGAPAALQRIHLRVPQRRRSGVCVGGDTLSLGAITLYHPFPRICLRKRCGRKTSS